MSFNSESYSVEEVVDTSNLTQEIIEQNEPTDDIFSLEGYFDDGFGDTEDEPPHVVLDEEKAREIEKKYAVNIASIIDKEKFAA